MLVDEKFNRRKVKRVEVSYCPSMNLAPKSDWINEAERVSVRFRDLNDENYNNPRYLLISMSRDEAKRLGEALSQYGNGPIQGEPGYEEKYGKLGG